MAVVEGWEEGGRERWRVGMNGGMEGGGWCVVRGAWCVRVGGLVR